jgi:hypothetical protein
MALAIISSEVLTVDATSGGVQFAFLTGATGSQRSNFRMAHVVIDTAEVRVTEDGTAPVATTTGKLVAVKGSFEIWGWDQLENLKFIREGSVSALAQVTFEGVGIV